MKNTMRKYPEFKGLNYAALADEVRSFWKENKVFERSVDQREGSETFTFYEGPPSANGTPGIHHVMARAVKDVFCRYKTLKGYQVKRKGGWDTHGLPVELQVEKELGITKDDIGKKISVEDYNKRCRETVMRFKDEWDELTEKMGYWVDLDNPYITFETDYIETLWHLLKRLYDKGLLYKGYTIQPYSPAAGTGLSSHELNQPGCYRMVKDTSITAQFQLHENKNHALASRISKNGKVAQVLAWTTTPWTLPANTALAVGKNINYSLIETFNPYTHEAVLIILASDRVQVYLHDKAKEIELDTYKAGDKLIPWKVVDIFKGHEMAGLNYEQLFPCVIPDGKAFEVVVGDFVTTEDGTGVVHTSPTFGADDFRVARENGIASLLVKDEDGKDVPVVDKKGKFVKEIGSYLSLKTSEYQIATHKNLGEDDFYVKNYTNEDENHPEYKSTDVIISIILKNEGKAFKVEKYEHTYPHCWRTDKPILYYPMESWFIKTTAYKDRMVELNKTINWKPESTGIGRFGNWLENLVDWNLSRSRYWGTPLPIWRTEDGKEEKCIGSTQELKTEIEKAIAAGIETFNPFDGQKEVDLHRPYVDQIVLLSDSGEPMQRESDLIDVWFDSGAMPYAQWHWPFENKDVFRNAYPADYIAEGVDQTRGWFFTLHALAVMLFDSVAFKNVIANGLVLDKNGNKMSKRLGNAINPFETLSTLGPDATRWYMISNANPWDNLKFNIDGITEVQRRFFSTLYNTYSFFALYANLDDFEFSESSVIPVAERPELDRWILSKLQSIIEEVEGAFENYDATRASRAIANFTSDQLSNWFVRLARKRFWRGEMTEDKKAAYETLFECLLTISQLMAPIAPFFAEWLFRNLGSGNQGPVSVHLSNWKSANSTLINTDLEASMQLAQDISSLVHSLRKKDKIKVRQPLQKILIPVLQPQTRHQIEHVEDLIKAEVNIKSIEYIDDASGILVKNVKPNLPKLGKQFGPKMRFITQTIQQWGQAEIAAIERNGTFELEIEGEKLNLELDDVIINSQDIPGWSVASEGSLTVALDITLSPALKLEGIARDLVNRIQNLRKEMGLEVQDKISIKVENSHQEASDAILEFDAYIKTETQALKIQFVDILSQGTVLDMDDFELKIEVSKEA
jgi:isoleucyl-tRNA synthetase